MNLVRHLLRPSLGLFLCTAANGVPAQCSVMLGPAVNTCAGDVVPLAPIVSGGTGPYSYQWSPQVGLSSAIAPSPQLTVQPGTITYTLVVTDALGCAVESTVEVTGLPNAQAQFTMDASGQICPGQVVMFEDQSGMPPLAMGATPKRVWSLSPAAGWSVASGEMGSMNGEPGDPGEWTSGSGELHLQFTAPGTFTMTLTLAGDCGTSSASNAVVVGNAPPAPVVATNSPLCAGQTLSLSAVPAPGTVFQWTAPSGDTFIQPSLNIPNATQGHQGTWTVAAIAAGCTGQPTEVAVIVTTPPAVSVSPGFTAFCVGGDVTLEATGAQAYTWYVGGAAIGSGNQLPVAPTVTTTYTVTGSSNGCAGFASATVLVHPMPVVEFATGTDACVGVPHDFSGSVTGAASLDWTFGDGASSGAEAPQHVFSTPGSYTVALQATSAAGCTASATNIVTVWEMPQAAFSLNTASGCAPLTVEFTDLSEGAGLQHAWSFGNGAVSEASNPQQVFGSAGTHQVALQVGNAGGCASTAVQEVVVHPVPVAGFDLPAQPQCEVPAQLQPVNTSSGATAYQWDLGNGVQSTATSPVVSYDAAGDYVVQLTAINDHGCSATVAATWQVSPAVVADLSLSPSVLCVGVPVTFSSLGGNVEEVYWELGDGSVSMAGELEHVYGAAGTYDVTLVVTGSGGCADTLVLQGGVTVLPAPVAAFTVVPFGTVDNALQFIDQSTDGTQAVWDFGPLETPTDPDPIVQFPADGGEWTVCLGVVNDVGCSDEACTPIELGPSPQLHAPTAFSPDGDGINDLFMPVLDGFTDWSYRITVFDRWGRQVFDGQDRHQGWDGTQSGGEVPVGVYIWQVELQGPGRERSFTGHVTLLR